ncbi:MAG: alpha-ketoglutarate-dependent dioxygenase AlkB [Bacteroidia bacterium]|nr:alpha-ketoglutarate-dependent dioxygenase AlkB [Bacteroidia bacterium]
MGEPKMTNFILEKLDADHSLYLGHLSADFPVNLGESFEEYWEMHPEDFHPMKIHGRIVLSPRWQQAYGANYRYTGSVNNALPISEKLRPFLEWSQENIDDRLNGILLNWYDGASKHYIGAHRDDNRDLMNGSPIVTISMGEERILRMRPYKEKGYRDFLLDPGSVVIIPEKTNLHWTHEVPHFARYKGRRISITLRAFEGGVLQEGLH